MVYTKQSEYGRAFKPKLTSYAKIYEDNCDFRRQRRNSQYAHHSELFVWDEHEWDSSESEDLNGQETGRSTRHKKIPPHKYKHEKYNRNYHAKKANPAARVAKIGQQTTDDPVNKVCQCQEKLKNGMPSPTDSQRSDSENSHHDHGVQTPDWDKIKSRKPSKVHNNNHSQNHYEHASGSQTVNGPQEERPRKPFQGAQYRKPLPKPRPMSAPLGRPSRKAEPTVPVERGKSPFVPYGFLDRERETAVKKTHNVRASCDVYPAARRAYLRRQTEIEKREEDSKKPVRRRVERQDPFSEKMTRETAGWETEYRQHYVPYDGNLYQRALSARLDPKKYAANLGASA